MDRQSIRQGIIASDCIVGDFEKEIQELKNVANSDDSDLSTITVSCYSFLTIICC